MFYGYTTWRFRTGQNTINAVEVEFYANIVFLRIGRGVSDSLHEILFFAYIHVLVSHQIHEGVVGNIEPHIVRKIVFMQCKNAVFAETPVLLCISETIAAVPAFGGREIGMRVQINRIYL